MYGKELILDIHNCDETTFTRESIKMYLEELCELIKMKREDLYFWDYEDDLEAYEKAPDHLKGTSVVQFIRTSTIVIHTLDVLEKVFVNIFSCKDFNYTEAERFTKLWFNGKVVNKTKIDRI